jgi:hypothetical protein
MRMTTPEYEPSSASAAGTFAAGVGPQLARRWEKRSVRVALTAGLLVAAFGAPVGWLWSELAPRLVLTRQEGDPTFAGPLGEEFIAADGWFAILGFAVGLVIAIAAWVLLPRQRGAPVLVALILGSLAGAWLAWYVGYRIGLAQFHSAYAAAPIGGRFDEPLVLRATNLDRHRAWAPLVSGVAAIQALVAAAVYSGLAGFSAYPGLRRPPPAPWVQAPYDHDHGVS